VSRGIGTNSDGTPSAISSWYALYPAAATAPSNAAK
jgi:hypothetical protein